jgi:hypothetical protein
MTCRQVLCAPNRAADAHATPLQIKKAVGGRPLDTWPTRAGAGRGNRPAFRSFSWSLLVDVPVRTLLTQTALHLCTSSECIWSLCQSLCTSSSDLDPRRVSNADAVKWPDPLWGFTETSHSPLSSFPATQPGACYRTERMLLSSWFLYIDPCYKWHFWKGMKRPHDNSHTPLYLMFDIFLYKLWSLVLFKIFLKY